MLASLLNDFCINHHIAPLALADGLCSFNALKKIRNNQKKTEKLLGDALWQRARKSLEKFDILTEHDEFSLTLERANIQLLIRRGKLEQAQKAIHQYKKSKYGNTPLHIQFLCLQYAEIYRRKKEPYDKQLRNLQKGIHQTVSAPKLSPDLLQTRLFSISELLLLERYAFLLSERDTEKASSWYNSLLHYFNPPYSGEAIPDEPIRFHLLPPLCYHHALLLMASGAYGQALATLDTGLFALRRHHSHETLFIRMGELRLKLMQESGITPPVSEINFLQALRQELEEDGMILFDHIYPDYPEHTILCVNDIIRERRLARGIHEEDMALAAGCDVRTLRGIENGKQMPQSETKNKFFRILGLSTWTYCPPLTTRTDSFFQENTDFIAYNHNGEYEKAKEGYEKICRGLDKKDLNNQYFAEYWENKLSYCRGEITEQKFQDSLSKMLQKTLTRYDRKNGMISFTKYERAIFVDLVWNMDAKDRLGIGEVLYAQYHKYHDNEALACLFPSYYMALSRCLARFARLRKKFNEAENILNDAQKQIHFLQNDLHLQALCLERFLLENDRRKALGLCPVGEGEDSFRWVRYAYACGKYYVQDTRNPRHAKWPFTDGIAMFREGSESKIQGG